VKIWYLVSDKINQIKTDELENDNKKAQGERFDTVHFRYLCWKKITFPGFFEILLPFLRE